MQSADMSTILESSVPSAVQQRKRIGLVLSVDIQETKGSSVPSVVIKNNIVYIARQKSFCRAILKYGGNFCFIIREELAFIGFSIGKQ